MKIDANKNRAAEPLPRQPRIIKGVYAEVWICGPRRFHSPPQSLQGALFAFVWEGQIASLLFEAGCFMVALSAPIWTGTQEHEKAPKRSSRSF
jgi:hypothetical protein